MIVAECLPTDTTGIIVAANSLKITLSPPESSYKIVNVDIPNIEDANQWKLALATTTMPRLAAVRVEPLNQTTAINLAASLPELDYSNAGFSSGFGDRLFQFAHLLFKKPGRLNQLDSRTSLNTNPDGLTLMGWGNMKDEQGNIRMFTGLRQGKMWVAKSKLCQGATEDQYRICLTPDAGTEHYLEPALGTPVYTRSSNGTITLVAITARKGITHCPKRSKSCTQVTAALRVSEYAEWINLVREQNRFAMLAEQPNVGGPSITPVSIVTYPGNETASNSTDRSSSNEKANENSTDHDMNTVKIDMEPTVSGEAVLVDRLRR